MPADTGTCSRHNEPLHLYVLGTRELPYVAEACRQCEIRDAEHDAGADDDLYGPVPAYFPERVA